MATSMAYIKISEIATVTYQDMSPYMATALNRFVPYPGIHHIYINIEGVGGNKSHRSSSTPRLGHIQHHST